MWQMEDSISSKDLFAFDFHCKKILSKWLPVILPLHLGCYVCMAANVGGGLC